jgi:CubicO group peptidase (beta-lactamase class C family)
MPKETAVAEPAAEPSIVEKLDALFAPWNRNDAPGLVVGVAKDGAVLYRRGFGMASLESFAANTPKTRMRIGSTSKHFTCLLALLLAEDGKLEIDAPVRRYIPELIGPAGDPTLRQLMHHRGGVRCHLELAALSYGMTPPPIGSALAYQIRAAGRSFAPGEAMLYSNGGYHLLSIAIERAGGAPFEDLLRQRLFEPVGMPDTASIPSDYDIVPGAATLHSPRPGGGWRRGLFVSEENRGEGAIISTIDDMLRWAAHLGRRDRFGSAATWQALMTAPPHADGSRGAFDYAFGLALAPYRGVATISHSGGVIGGTSQMLIAPDHGLEIVILANGAEGANPSKLATDVVDIVLADQLGEVAATLPAAPYAALLGDWWSPETGMVYSLADKDGGLQVGCCKMLATAPLTPRETGRPVFGDVSFDLDAALADPDGGLTIGFCGHDSVYQRVSEAATPDPAFAERIAGRYVSPDADVTVEIRRQADKIVLEVVRPANGMQVELVGLGERVAYSRPTGASPGLGEMMALAFKVFTFPAGDGPAPGFKLNAFRTRDLAFVRD